MKEFFEKNKIFVGMIIAAIMIGVFIYLLDVENVLATSGACSWHGGVNCAAGPDWDGSVICNDGWRDSSVSYSSMAKCRGYFEYDYPSYTPSIPDCPYNSYYDSISDSCKCYSGYVASGGKCVSVSQWCQDKYGLWATYDYLTDSCKCTSGYMFGKDFLGKTTCISADQYCRDNYGFHARYNTLTDSCECSYGYVLSGGKCVDGDTLCRQQYGYHSYYDSLSEECKCNYGYVFDSNDQCVREDDYCEDLYGYYAEHDSLSDKCVCQRGYVFNDSMTKCIDGDTYCQNLYGSHSGYDSLTKMCKCNYEYKLKDSQCVTPEISGISPLRAEVGEEVTIKGEHFGDSKYNDLKLYVGSTKVNTLDISKWQDNKIVFEVGDYLDSGYVVLKGDEVNIRSSYLEISESEEADIFVYPSLPMEEKPAISQQMTPEPKLYPESQSEPESQPEELHLESQLTEETEPEIQQEISGEPRQEQKESIWIFLASIFTAAKNFFLNVFRWF